MTQQWKTFLSWTAAAVSMIVLISLLFALVMPLPKLDRGPAAEIYDRDGDLIKRLNPDGVNRIPIEGNAMADTLREAVVSVEDIRFYRHPGIDPIAIGRALVHNLAAGQIEQGGSTISQQLARNLYLSQERTLTRKLKELFYTVKLESQLNKEEILTLYLNEIYLGHGTYGVEAAAQLYFNKPASALTLSESALLAGLVRSPESYSPFRHPERAKQRRNTVLHLMVEADYIDETKATQTAQQPLKLAELKKPDDDIAYFTSYIMDQIAQRHPFRVRDMYREPYQIYTTLDLDLQQAGAQALEAGLPSGTTDSRGIRQPQGALITIDPRSGAIRAMIGGREFRNVQNRATSAWRPPGSAFKPFLYAAVLDQGYTAISTQLCQLIEIPTSDGVWRPTDYGDHPYHNREITVREALAISDNVAAVRWAQQIGPETIARYARAFGIESELTAAPSLALGTSSVTPLEMARAYSIFANGGYRVEPYAIRRIVAPGGTVLEEKGEPELEPVLDSRVAYLITDMLKDVLDWGTAASAGRRLTGMPVAGKTGTHASDLEETGSSHNLDAWFVGYSPNMVTSIWVGNDHNQPLQGSGPTLAAPIWSRFTAAAIESGNRSSRDFPRPDGLVDRDICPEMDSVPEGSPDQIYGTEVFRRDRAPNASVCRQPEPQIPEPEPDPQQPGSPEPAPEESPPGESPEEEDERLPLPDILRRWLQRELNNDRAHRG